MKEIEPGGGGMSLELPLGSANAKCRLERESVDLLTARQTT